MQTSKMKQKTLGKRKSSGKFKLARIKKQTKFEQIKLRDLSKEIREKEVITQEPSTSYSEAASNWKGKPRKKKTGNN